VQEEHRMKGALYKLLGGVLLEVILEILEGLEGHIAVVDQVVAAQGQRHALVHNGAATASVQTCTMGHKAYVCQANTKQASRFFKPKLGWAEAGIRHIIMTRRAICSHLLVLERA
jgi:hypothetical protein